MHHSYNSSSADIRVRIVYGSLPTSNRKPHMSAISPGNIFIERRHTPAKMA